MATASNVPIQTSFLDKNRLSLESGVPFFVIPAQAGIQKSSMKALRLDSGLRRNDDILLSGESHKVIK